MAQTAVRWILIELQNKFPKDMYNMYNGNQLLLESLFLQAKAMEKEQMISAMIYTFNQQNTLPYGMEYLLNRDGMLEDCENYYKETYGE